ncbi:hypothetical protein MNBD_IGNAVI01-3150 [hydrothermal vent metagenome]|uniref:Uncharacterized protein n=1 Tax=hydrothermal vent metagenome TaxID=652676 RepID=A0A3B1CN79_9ZZZZ
MIIRIIISILILTSVICAQNQKTRSVTNDSLNNLSNELIKPKTIISDWRIFNYPFTSNSTLEYYSGSIYSSPFSAMNSPFQNYNASKEEMLAQFRSLQNWGAKKKYNVFAKYLSYAQFLGAMSLLGVHVYQWYNLKNLPSSQPKSKPFNKYDFK